MMLNGSAEGLKEPTKVPASARTDETPSSESTRARQTSGGALVIYKRPPRAIFVPTRIAERDQLAETFLEWAHPGYYQLIEDPSLTTVSDGITAIENLMYDQDAANKELLDELTELSNEYFRFKPDLFHFEGRKDRTLLDLLRRPATYADLEEEIIEEKFPEDIKTRAFIHALILALERNQWRHIFKKRLRQAFATVPIAAVAVAWPALSKYVYGVGNPLGISLIPEGSFAPLVSVGAFAVCALGYGFIGHVALRKFYKDLTTLFQDKNRASCKSLVQHMVKLNGRIRANFTKLLGTDVENSEKHFKSIRQDDWPVKAKRLFKLGLWQAKRIEYLEKFWQVQLERLRVFELWSDAAGNSSSRVLAVAMAVGAALAGTWSFGMATWGSVLEGEFLGIFGVVALVAWHFGRLSRKDDFSFAMKDIVKQGFKEWDPFSTLRYYEKIAGQYESGKGAFQIDRLKDLAVTGQTPRAGRG